MIVINEILVIKHFEFIVCLNDFIEIKFFAKFKFLNEIIEKIIDVLFDEKVDEDESKLIVKCELLKNINEI